MVRPKLPAKDRRDVVPAVRFTRAEHRLVAKAAARKALRPSTFMREAILRAARRAVR